MKGNRVVCALAVVLAVASRAAAEEGFEFTLEEVEASAKPKNDKQAKAREPEVDIAQAIEQSLGGLRWGMSKAELLKALKAQIRAEFEERIKVERDILRQDALYQEAQERYRRLNDNYVSFDGQKTGWDVSPIAPEFTHGNRESMLVVSRGGVRDMYFFIQGRLWKWYREISPGTAGAPAGDVMSELDARFGRGKPQGDRRSEAKVTYPGATWSDDATRVTAIRRGAEVCLIFEDARTLEQLQVLRHNVQPKSRADRASAVIDAVLLSDSELEARTR